MIIDLWQIQNRQTINYHSSINHEKETRTKINHPEYRPFDSI